MSIESSSDAASTIKSKRLLLQVRFLSVRAFSTQMTTVNAKFTRHPGTIFRHQIIAPES